MHAWVRTWKRDSSQCPFLPLQWADFTTQLKKKLPDTPIYAIAFVDPLDEDTRAKMVKSEGEWHTCLACCLQEKDHELEVDLLEQPPAKPYKLALKCGKVEKKKITYANPYERCLLNRVLSPAPFAYLRPWRQINLPDAILLLRWHISSGLSVYCAESMLNLFL